jgi:hypothetical protein
MHLGQLLMVVLAVILFSTAVLSMYNNLVVQLEMVTMTNFQNQAILVLTGASQRVYTAFQSMDEGLPEMIENSFAGWQPLIPPLVFESLEATYTAEMRSFWCNDLGAIIPAPAIPGPEDHIIVFFRVRVDNDMFGEFWAADIEEGDFATAGNGAFTYVLIRGAH